MKKLLAIVVLGLLWNGSANAEKIEDLYLACKDNITTVNEGTFEKGLFSYSYFYFKLEKAVDFTKYTSPYMNIKKYKLTKQVRIGEKKIKFGGGMKLKWNLNPNNLMEISRISLENLSKTTDRVVMIAITMNRLKHSNEKKWDYTYSYYWKDIDGTDNFVAVDYCNEMSKKELNAFAKKKIF